jgi:hypothetical protein
MEVIHAGQKANIDRCQPWVIRSLLPASVAVDL